MTHNLKSVVTWSFLDLAICKNPASGPIISKSLFSIFKWISSFDCENLNFFD